MVNTAIRQLILFAAKDREALYSQQKQDRKLTVAQIMNSLSKFILLLKKVGKTTRQFRYDLNQIPYNYVVEVIKEIRGNKSDRMPEELWAEVGDIVQETVIKTITPKTEMQKRQNGFLRRPHK